ncbi:hypothetical protein B0T11DRAFT_349745 [Plectosphaerella cucumerina]|uniref:Hydrophobin n=1 Tax=Plectosphaerella cucumerina TaxID=40658 RepID=A0A8K0TS05_9PEZI|nr:hypothetical protein B0T11DRAFT_349745 [Plectosphaerella cucumerina]
MKFSMVLALPALALAAATPANVVEERQIPGLPLPALPLDLQCLLGVTGILACLPNPGAAPVLTDLLGCPLGVITRALSCVTGGLPLPLPKN